MSSCWTSLFSSRSFSIKLVLFFFLINQLNASQDLINLLEVKELQFNYFNYTTGDHVKPQILCTSFDYTCFYSPRKILCTNNDYKNYAKVNANNKLSWTCKQNEWFSFISYVWFEDSSVDVNCEEVRRSNGLTKGKFVIKNSCSVKFILQLSISYLILCVCLMAIAFFAFYYAAAHLTVYILLLLFTVLFKLIWIVLDLFINTWDKCGYSSVSRTSNEKNDDKIEKKIKVSSV